VQHAVELAAGGDAELGEDLAQVVLGGVGADEQPGADRAGQFRAQPGAAEPVDRLPVQVLRGPALADQRAAARLDAQSPVRAILPGDAAERLV